MSIQSNTFCWHGISTQEDTGKAFYTNVLGWNVAADGDGPPVFIGPGGAVAHLQAPENGPANWCNYLAVDDLDASHAKAEAHGSAVLVPPTNLPAGRFSIVTTPSGAVVALYESAPADEQAKRGAGSIHWVELQSTAPTDDLTWLHDVFGFTSRTVDMASGPYHLLESDGATRGGVTPSRSGHSAFVAWVHVEALDDTLTKVRTAGGTVISEVFADPEVGQMVMVADPSGAAFGLVQPA